MSDQALSEDERELVRLVDGYSLGYELGLASYEMKEDLDKILAHYRKAKADAFERGRHYTPPPIDPGSDPGAHHA